MPASSDPLLPFSATLAGLRVLVAAPDIAVLVLRAAALAGAGARVYAALSREAAMRQLDGARPIDAAVIEIGLPGGALALEAELRHGEPPCPSIVVGSADAATARELLATGAAAHVSPPALPHVLVPLVARVAAIGRTRRSDPKPRGPTRPQASAGVERAIAALAHRRGLSDRERAVLRGIALGYRYEEIGHELRIATRTVKMHAANLRKKTGVGSRSELLREVFDP